MRLPTLRLAHFWVAALTTALAVPIHAQPSAVKQRHAYDSRYLVFGTKTSSDTPRLLAIDLNRTARGPDRVTYEYKLFTATGGDWTLRVYDRWTVDPDTTERFPAHQGLRPVRQSDERLRVEADGPSLSLRVQMTPPSFAFRTDSRFGTIRTAHPTYVVSWNGATYEGRGVYEWVQGSDEESRGTSEERAEARRQIDDAATFGRYDWMVLYDETGRLLQVSQGTLTQDFAYQRAVDGQPAATRDVLVRWLRTEPDSVARTHSPTRWLVDVPAWTTRVQLRKTGEHRGHGPERDDGTRPVYVFGTVTGEGMVFGERREVFGLVELIQD